MQFYDNPMVFASMCTCTANANSWLQWTSKQYQMSSVRFLSYQNVLSLHVKSQMSGVQIYTLRYTLVKMYVF